MRSNILKALFLCILPLLIQAGELFSGRIYTEPKKIFINQPFEIFLEVEITPGLDIDNIRIQGFPNDPSFITLGQLEQEHSRRTRKTKEGQIVDLLLFHANARCHKSISLRFNPILSCNVVQRRSRSFFSFSSSSPRRVRINPFTLTVHALPSAGKPNNFSGAIGKFNLKGSLSRTKVRPGDIITMQLNLTGEGWLNNCVMPTPTVSDKFKRYPVKESQRQKNKVTSEQIFIPLSTNAVEIGAAHFTYFNPQTEHYEECASPVFNLEFLSAQNGIQTNQIKVISTDAGQTPAHTPSASINLQQVNAAFHQMLPIITGSLFILAASFIFLVLLKVNRWIAIAASIITLTAGTLLTFKATHHEPTLQSELKQQTAVYLTPSIKSPVIMKLRAATLVTPLESAGDWIRVESADQRGWIERDHIKEVTTQKSENRIQESE